MSEQHPDPLEAEIVPDPAPKPAPISPAAFPAPVTPDYDEHGVPSLDYVRDKIEQRYGRSLGNAELFDESVPGRALEQQAAEREKAAAERLAEIRKSLGHP